MKFQGKVCHAGLGITSPIELQKQVLRDLTDTNPDSLTFQTEEMVRITLHLLWWLNVSHVFVLLVFLSMKNASEEYKS